MRKVTRPGGCMTGNISYPDNKLQSILTEVSNEIKHFKDEFDSNPRFDPKRHDLDKLISSIERGTQALVDFESVRGQQNIQIAKLAPELRIRIVQAMQIIHTFKTFISKGSQEKASEKVQPLIVALNALKEFQHVIKNVDPENDLRLKRGRKIEGVSEGSST